MKILNSFVILVKLLSSSFIQSIFIFSMSITLFSMLRLLQSVECFRLLLNSGGLELSFILKSLLDYLAHSDYLDKNKLFLLFIFFLLSFLWSLFLSFDVFSYFLKKAVKSQFFIYCFYCDFLFYFFDCYLDLLLISILDILSNTLLIY